SIIAANSGGSAASAALVPRRVIIAEPADQRQWPEATALGRAVADSLGRMLRARRQQFTVIDPDSVRAALSRSRDPNDLGKVLNSDIIVSIRLQALRDSAQLLLQ